MDIERHRAAERAYWEQEGVVPTERWVDLPRTGCRVRVQELGEGPPVLFVHGASNSGTSWATLASRMPGFRCILLDRPGCGLSEPLPRPATDLPAFVDHADHLLAEVLDALELDDAHLVVSSLGGYHGLRTAAAHPERVRRMVALCFPFGATCGPLPVVMRIAAFGRLGRVMAGIPKPRRAVRSMMGQIGLRQALAAGRVSDLGITWFWSLLNHTDTMVNDLDAGPPLIRAFRGTNPAVELGDEVLGRIRTPTLFLWGADDPFGGAAVARGFAPRVAATVLQIVPGGHAVWMDDADATAASVSAFLSSDR